MKRNLLLSTTSVAGCLVLLATGCASLDVKKPTVPWKSSSQEKSKYESPDRIIAIWSDTVYQHPGKPATRGFGGRIYFYNDEGKTIPVDGQLIVYAFDDSSPEAGSDKPTRKYGFTAEQLTGYYSDSELGASYNIWIPWDGVGNAEKQISLFPVFVDASGRTVRGTFANNRLPGKRNVSEEERRGFYVSPHQKPPAPGDQTVQQVQYQAVAGSEITGSAPRESGLKTTTIRVPRTMAERMAAAPPVLLQAQPYQPSPAAALPNQLPYSGPVGPTPATTPAGQPANYPAAGSTPQPNWQNGAQNAGSPNTPVSQLPAHGARLTAPALGQTGFIGADPRNSTSARSRAWARQDEQSAHFEPPRFRVPTMPGVQQPREREPIQQSPLTPLYSPPSPR